MNVGIPALNYPILIIVGVIVLRAAWTDLREYKIRNELVLTLASLFVLHSFLFGRWVELRWDVAFAFLIFVFLIGFYSLGWMGGGDVKMLAVAFLWTGISGALPFAVLLALFSLIHGLAARLGWVGSQFSEAGRRCIPYAPSIAGAMICTLMLKAVHVV